MWIRELELSRHRFVKYFILMNPAALPPHEDARVTAASPERHNYIFICVLISLNQTVVSDSHWSSAQALLSFAGWFCSHRAAMAKGQPRGTVWAARSISGLGLCVLGSVVLG